MLINIVPDDCLMYTGFILIFNITSIVYVKHRKKNDNKNECLDKVLNAVLAPYKTEQSLHDVELQKKKEEEKHKKVD